MVPRPVRIPGLLALREVFDFPDPNSADASGLLAYGGDLGPERLLAAYASGIFPWYNEEPILWFSPDPRAVLLPDDLRISRSLRRTLRREPFELRFDTVFERVIRICAETPRPGQQGTWITPAMIDAYCELHARGFAHCAEAWQDGELAGGLYGVSLGTAFFGESMFAARSDASKVAFVALVRQLAAWGFDFVDCQMPTDHLARFGSIQWPRAQFLERLDEALSKPTRRGQWRFESSLLTP